ncbi:monovalent cation:proton antiporter-2 (CPA2) family protein [Sphingobium ummariense]|uniref:RCK N-terminal domain-containing protein n=1 Tax=Sphingobium ummariense RL-3 TaxID=1346791 RepID=T0INF7_9SPHN|nr:monovalent cation:proton antiporter-2 (CPA2) family protein [Sphingobium ummariense]EQB30375.1 hypothetical protein M529_20140 [Sphingobium ummariense RL-3]
MAAESHALDLFPVLVLLGAATLAAPLSQRLGLGSVLGYLAAGLVIGPFGTGLLSDPAQLLHVAELGIVLFLFLIGLEMRPSRLWKLRGAIFGIGLTQLCLAALGLTAVGVVTGFPAVPSFVAGIGFGLTSTAIVMRLLEEQGRFDSGAGQEIVAILLLEDMAIVPLLLMVTFLAPAAVESTSGRGITGILVGVTSIGGLFLAGRYLLNPLFRLLAGSQAREVMTAAALLVVLGAAWLMQLGGLSMAMGAFLAGVLLSESIFRHQLEADIEPFRGILLGLFFIAVGMSLDLSVVAQNWRLILFFAFAYMATKAAAIYAVARLFRSGHEEGAFRAAIMAQGGEFAFVLYAAAHGVGIITRDQVAILNAIIILSMALTPLVMLALRQLRGARPPETIASNLPQGLSARALVIGFGRFGQIASQFLLARGDDVSIIDTDIEMIDVARDFEFEVYYGDGTRLDILRTAGVDKAAVVLVCVDNPIATTRIVELLTANFPRVPVLARASDRVHMQVLDGKGAAFSIRETFESAMMLGQKAIELLGATTEQMRDYGDRIRARDAARLEREQWGDVTGVRALFSGDRAKAAIDLSVHETAPDRVASRQEKANGT